MHHCQGRQGFRHQTACSIVTLLALLAMAVTASACQAHPASNDSSGANKTSSAPPTSTPFYDLTLPGNARTVVNFLRDTADGKPVIRVEVQRDSANLTFLAAGKAVTVGFAHGKIAAIDSTVEYIGQTSFDPASFNIDDVGQLFTLAADRSGSDLDQDLQINEYQQGQVLMTVTTTPESSTVFFRQDGSPINILDFGTATGVAEAISDTVQGRHAVLAMGYQPASGLWVDVRKDASTVERSTRQSALPTIVAQRNQPSSLRTFDPRLVDPAVLARLLQTLPAVVGKPDNTPVSVTIDARAPFGTVQMYFDVGSTPVVTTLSGQVVALR